MQNQPDDPSVTPPPPSKATAASTGGTSTVTYGGPSGVLVMGDREYQLGVPVAGVAAADAAAVKEWCDDNGHEVTLS